MKSGICSCGARY